MKVTELMIKDWVHSSFFGITQIKAIKEYEGFGWIVTTTNENWKSDTSLTPIPLTPEILWKNCESPDIVEWYPEHPTTAYHIHIEQGYITIDGSIHYVHELQHALRLCGLKELADNFIV